MGKAVGKKKKEQDCTQLTFTCLKSTTKTPEQCVKRVQS